MFWMALAVGLAARGWWVGGFEGMMTIGAGIFAGVIGVRRAVMQWDKPGALVNCIATVVAFGFLIALMIADDQDRKRSWQQEHASSLPAPEQKRESAQPVAQAPAPNAPASEHQMFPSMEELASGGGQITSSMQQYWMEPRQAYKIDGKGACAAQVHWEGDPMSANAVSIGVEFRDEVTSEWTDYREEVKKTGNLSAPWAVHWIRAEPAPGANVKNLHYMLWCSESRKAQTEARRLKQLEHAKTSETAAVSVDNKSRAVQEKMAPPNARPKENATAKETPSESVAKAAQPGATTIKKAEVVVPEPPVEIKAEPPPAPKKELVIDESLRGKVAMKKMSFKQSWSASTDGRNKIFYGEAHYLEESPPIQNKPPCTLQLWPEGNFKYAVRLETYSGETKSWVVDAAAERGQPYEGCPECIENTKTMWVTILEGAPAMFVYGQYCLAPR